MKDFCELLACCGEFCGSCDNFQGLKEPRCIGCETHQGHPFWGLCRIHTCVVSHDVDHCGLCMEFPCEELVSHYDPSHPEGQRNALFRTGILAYRAKNGDGKTLTLVRKLGRKREAAEAE